MTVELPVERSKPIKDIHEYSFLIYGQPKAGKSTFASNFDKALFIATEPGHKFLEVFKVSPLNWSDIQSVATKLFQQRNDKKFKTVIFDTIDNAWGMAEDHVIREHNAKNPENKIDYIHDLQYGKGSRKTRAEVMKVVNVLGQCGYGVVFLSHEKVSEVEENGITRNKRDITLSQAARKDISGFCDFILYCYIDNKGDRHLITKGDPALNAGDRSNLLPKDMPLDFNLLTKYLMEEK